MKPLRIGYLNYPWVYESELPVVLAFGAEWDLKSLRFWGMIERMSVKYDGMVVFGFVDIEYARGIFSEFDIVKFPAIVGIDNGKAFRTIQNVKTQTEIERYIDYMFGVLPYSPMEKY